MFRMLAVICMSARLPPAVLDRRNRRIVQAEGVVVLFETRELAEAADQQEKASSTENPKQQGENRASAPKQRIRVRKRARSRFIRSEIAAPPSGEKAPPTERLVKGA